MRVIIQENKDRQKIITKLIGDIKNFVKCTEDIKFVYCNIEANSFTNRLIKRV